jgi:hypothetical protein
MSACGSPAQRIANFGYFVIGSSGFFCAGSENSSPTGNDMLGVTPSGRASWDAGARTSAGVSLLGMGGAGSSNEANLVAETAFVIAVGLGTGFAGAGLASAERGESSREVVATGLFSAAAGGAGDTATTALA